MEYPIEISKDKYYKAAIKVINCFLNLTDFEIEVIVTMLNFNIKTLDKATRLQVRSILDKTEMSFNNYIKRLKDKQVLIDTAYGLAIHPNIVNQLEDKEIVIKFKIRDAN